MDFYLILYGIGLVALCTIFHELGHYILDKYYGRRAWFRFRVRGGVPAFITSSQRTFEIRNGNDLKRALKEEVRIAQGGLLSVIIPILFLYLDPGFVLAYFILLVIFMGYTVWEVGMSINVNELEKIGNINYNL
jgi:hypothetical protein